MPFGLLNLAAFWSRFDGMGPNFKGYIFNSTIPFLYREKDVIHILNREKENGKSGHQMEKTMTEAMSLQKKLTMVKFSSWVLNVLLTTVNSNKKRKKPEKFD